jgi:hypothetical protein
MNPTNDVASGFGGVFMTKTHFTVECKNLQTSLLESHKLGVLTIAHTTLSLSLSLFPLSLLGILSLSKKIHSTYNIILEFE